MTNLDVSAAAPSVGASLSRSLDGAVPLAARLLVVPLFLLSGISKLGSAEATIGWIDAAGLPFATLAYLGAVTVEILGSVALVAGFQTRLVATVMALFTIAAALAFHNQLSDQNQFIHFFKNIAIAGGLLQIVAYGGGRYSVDALIGRNRK